MPSEAAVRSFFTQVTGLTPIGDPAGQKAVFGCQLEDGRDGVLKLVTLPEIIDEDSSDACDEVIARLRREIGILASIDSPHVARLAWPERDLLFASIDGGSCVYYFEERVLGPSVQGLIDGSPVLDHRLVARLGAHVSRGILEFWSRAKVHRDIKPANIMYDEPQKRFVLLDAGYALDLAGPSLTRVLGIAGTLPYFSPEQLDLSKKRSLDFRSDLYQLGVVMYVALSAEHPYLRRGMNQEQKFEAIATTAAQAPATIAPGSDAVWEITLRLLEKRPHARYRSCEFVYSALDTLY